MPMTKRIFLFISLFCVLAFESCTNVTSPAVSEGTYTSDKAYNLNVIYFIQKDVTAPADYERRISEILLNMQDFYGKEMERNGYGYKTFGLIKNDVNKRIKLIVIPAKFGKSKYPYTGGAQFVKAEIDDYKAAHPSEFTSDHCLIILPGNTYDSSGDPGDVPFYGLGKDCYALDYADQDVKYLGTGGVLGSRASKWIGGMAHELGHGLNLPHNRQKQTESSLGMALMSAGNLTYGSSKTFLTSADCAILNRNQIFNTGNDVYYGAVTAYVTQIQGNYDASKGAIVVSGNYSSSSPVTDVLYFNDPNVNGEGIGGAMDYNAITWTSKPIQPNSFNVEMPISGLEFKSNNIPYELRVRLVHQNGTWTTFTYAYTFLNNVPVLKFSTHTEISKSGWSVVSFSSAGDGGAAVGPATNLIDGIRSTYWHSGWAPSSPVFPHQFVIDMGGSKTASGLSITQNSFLWSAVKEAELYTSSDGTSFTLAGSYTFANDLALGNNGVQYFDFTAAKTFRYFKIVAKSAWDGLGFASLAEVGMY
jgi:hypothetical protein